MQFCQGSAPSPALLFTGMKKGTEHFSAVHIVLRCLKELLKSMWGGGESKEESQKRQGQGAYERRVPEVHLQSRAVSSTNTSNTSTLLPPSLLGSPSAGLGAHLLGKVRKFQQYYWSAGYFFSQVFCPQCTKH